MALDIYLSDTHSKEVFFEADGYYFFLYPLFEDLAQQTGQMIDLYNDALFENASLQNLKSTLEKAKQLIQAQPDEWDVVTGWTDQTKKTPTHDKVSKERFQKLLDEFSQLVDTAIKAGKPIKCVGD